jgi:hypothetical protein
MKAPLLDNFLIIALPVKRMRDGQFVSGVAAGTDGGFKRFLSVPEIVPSLRSHSHGLPFRRLRPEILGVRETM